MLLLHSATCTWIRVTWIFKQEHWLPFPYNLLSTCANKLWERYMSHPGYQENKENTSSFVRVTPRHAKICTVHMIQPRIKCSSFWGWSVGQGTSSLIAVELRWQLGWELGREAKSPGSPSLRLLYNLQICTCQSQVEMMGVKFYFIETYLFL